MTVHKAMCTREQDLRIPASVMKVLYCHKSLYAVRVCEMVPRSGNLVESGMSRLSSCQMQQILFQYPGFPAGNMHFMLWCIKCMQLKAYIYIYKTGPDKVCWKH